MARKKNIPPKEESVSFLEKLPEFPIDYADMDRYVKDEISPEIDLVFRCPLCGTILEAVHEDYCSNFNLRGDCQIFNV